MTTELVDPNSVEIDELNERKTIDELVDADVEVEDLTELTEREWDDLGDFGQLIKSVAEMGIVQPPLARRRDDGTLCITVGQRRTLAARAAELDEMPVIVMDWTDEEALKASITENIDLFSKRVPMNERAEALKKLWEFMGGSGMPVQSHLGKTLGVPRETVRTWLEPLHDGWKDTSIDPTSTTDDDDDDPVGNDIGERSIAEIRRMTGGGDEGEECVRYAEMEGLTQPEIKDARKLVDEDGFDPLDALKQIASDEEASEQRISANVEFDSVSSTAIKNYADRTDQPPAAVIVKAVQWFLKSEGELDD